jgi:hypothetical protein
MHHGREPMSMMTLAYTIDWIANRYAERDIETMSLLETRQMWFVLIVNPDGYNRNIETKSSQDRLQRKNTEKGCLLNPEKSGVDLNRNYDYCFSDQSTDDCTECGSNSDPCAPTYRGPHPFSEPETIAIRNFVLTHNVTAALNYHSYGEQILWPYSCAHHSRQLEWSKNIEAVHFVGRKLAKLNKYSPGNVKDSLRYNAAGDASDWMYGEHGIISLTPETGPSDEAAVAQDIEAESMYGFYPPAGKIAELANVNIEANIKLAWMTGEEYDLEIASFQQSKWQNYSLEVILLSDGLDISSERLFLGLTGTLASGGEEHALIQLVQVETSLLTSRNISSLPPIEFTKEDLEVVGGISAAFYIFLGNGNDVCTLFSISDLQNGPRKIEQRLHLRPCDMCHTFLEFLNKNTTYFDGNSSLPRITARPRSRRERCSTQAYDNDLSKCSGVGIPKEFDWIAFGVGVLTTFIILTIALCVYLKFRSLFNRPAGKSYSNIEILNVGKKHPKFKDMEPGTEEEGEEGDDDEKVPENRLEVFN